MSNAGSGTIILTVPDAPLNLVNVPLITNSYEIGLYWIDGVQNGGSSIIDYKLTYKIGTGAFEVLETCIMTNYYTVLPLTSGQTYTFMVQSRNVMGYSDYSNTVTVTTA